MDSSYSVRVGDCTSSSSSSYEVEKILGSGRFGVVTLSRNNTSGQKVALKVLKQKHNNSDAGQKEAQILRRLKERGSESHHIVQWIDSFPFKGNFCHEFERLDINLMEFMSRSPFKNLPLKHIRPILTQMIGALLFLKSNGVIHCDLKPANVMMIDHVRQPLKVKLIDFGLARSVSDAQRGQLVQTVYYRAPEVAVGASFNETADMWSVGCIIAEMFLGKILFRADDREDLIRMIVQTLGQPPKHILDSGRCTQKYFCLPEGSSDWIHVVKQKQRQNPCAVPLLDSIYKMDPYRDVKDRCEAEDFDRRVFVQLVKYMLDLDPQTRISPEAVLDHPFLTLTHLIKNKYYLESNKIQLQALDLYQKEQPSTSSTSCKGPKRRREEQESARKRTKRDASVLVVSPVQRSGACEQSPEENKLECASTKRDEEVIMPQSPTSSPRKRKTRHKEENTLDSVCEHKKKLKTIPPPSMGQTTPPLPAQPHNSSSAYGPDDSTYGPDDTSSSYGQDDTSSSYGQDYT